ncbi:MAG: nucleotide sugar dehydrogenase, partial [Spirochaetota bacterium]|nr:nucleotide sugar dehydrogenase [Spirochaetota bacterium]
MTISMIGTGYVGLTTGTGFAEMGNEVYCVDIDKSKIDMLNKGITPIYEPGLEELIKRNVREKRLFFTTDIALATRKSHHIFLAVGTPPDEDGSADLQHVLAAARDVATHMESYKTITIKSTVPVGTGKMVREAIQSVLDQRGVQIAFDTVSNPEFLKEGAAIEDFMKPDRIIIGTDSEKAAKAMDLLYKPLVRNRNRIIHMDIPSAEMCKYAANAMLATRISFMNELSRLCEKVGADVEQVRHGIGSDSRIGTHFIYPGL